MPMTCRSSLEKTAVIADERLYKHLRALEKARRGNGGNPDQTDPPDAALAAGVDVYVAT